MNVSRIGAAMSSQIIKRTVAILAVSTAMWAFGATSASAHSGLESSNPADGSVVTEAPASISLTFNEDLLPGANSVSLNATDGTSITSAKVEPMGKTVDLPWPAELAAGDYQVAYRVVSADGHPVTGAIYFSFAPAEALATPASSSPAMAESAPAEPSTSALAISENAEPESTGGTPWLGLGIAVAIGLALIVLFAAIRRRRA